MVSATEWLKKAEAKRSKNQGKFQAVRRRAWDYVDSTQEVQPPPSDDKSVIWEQKEEQIRNDNRNNSKQNWEQSGNESENKQERKQEQNKNQYENEYRNNLVVKQAKNTGVQDHLVLDDITAQKRLLTLTGHQKQVMKHITSHLKSRIGGADVIDILPTILAQKINAGLEVTRVTLKRLAGKRLLVKLPGERGRNGCCKFRIQENIVKICFSLFNDAPCDINHIGNEIGNTNRNNQLYSSSNNITITTVLPDNWEQIDFSSLTAIGFSKTQLMQLYEKQLNTPEVIQESITHFAYGLANNPKFKTYTAPLNVLIGVLRKGQAWYEPGYVPPKELALRQMLEEKRKQKEQFDVMIKELIELEFPDWKRKLTDEEMKEIVPLDVRKTNLSAAIAASLRTYFTEKVLLPRLEQSGVTGSRYK